MQRYPQISIIKTVNCEGPKLDPNGVGVAVVVVAM
jgi:hypothetical protein